jgi:hypothetical protein
LVTELDGALGQLFHGRIFPEQPDSRAFGAAIEDAAVREWPALCHGIGVDPLPRPGRRTIYDAAFVANGALVGVDFRTKDLERGRYSDGGICAVGNLLRWMVRDHGTLLVAEVGYRIKDAVADIRYVATAPIHVLPKESYRIENLGTGQLRLNASIADAVGGAVWSRTHEEFFELFAGSCIDHYERVAAVAIGRAAAITSFVECGYAEISLR